MLRRIAIIGANGFVGRQILAGAARRGIEAVGVVRSQGAAETVASLGGCLLYKSDAADERTRGGLGGGRLLKKKKKRSCTR